MLAPAPDTLTVTSRKKVELISREALGPWPRPGRVHPGGGLRQSGEKRQERKEEHVIQSRGKCKMTEPKKPVSFGRLFTVGRGAKLPMVTRSCPFRAEAGSNLLPRLTV